MNFTRPKPKTDQELLDKLLILDIALTDHLMLGGNLQDSSDREWRSFWDNKIRLESEIKTIRWALGMEEEK